MWRIFLFITFIFAKGDANDCVPYKVDGNVLACICNATYCDSTPPYNSAAWHKKTSYWYVSDKQGLRLQMRQAKFGGHKMRHHSKVLHIDTTKRHQKILGFGGAFADSVGTNLRKLSPGTQDQLIRTYYDQKSGSRYSIGRVPIAGTDFSSRAYTYDDVENDAALKHFALTRDDYELKIPYMKKALKLNPELKFYASSWSAPSWMKTNGKRNGFGFLKEEYNQVYANYILKFLDEYKKNGINIWAITTGNEPLNAFTPNFPLTTMGWTPEMMANWVGNYMGPTLANSKHNNTIILALDDNRVLLPWFVNPIFTNEKSSKYTKGTAVHWYYDAKQPPEVLDLTHDEFPDKFILMSEAASKPQAWGSPNVLEMAWQHAEDYALSIIQYMNHWAIGWVDWCLALDEQGGPSWLGNNIDSAVMVNPDTDEFYKLPIYHAIKHFSRFVDRGSHRVSITDTPNVKATAFVTPCEEVVVVLYNKNGNKSEPVTLMDSKKQYPLSLELSPKSINTIIYRH